MFIGPRAWMRNCWDRLAHAGSQRVVALERCMCVRVLAGHEDGDRNKSPNPTKLIDFCKF